MRLGLGLIGAVLCAMIVVTLALTSGAFGTSTAAAQVLLDTGSVVGESQDDLAVYRGIPFAQAPVGELRWTPPRPLPVSDQQLNTADYGARCWQAPRAQDSAPMSEDCLFLNVWAPDSETSEALPVMVWVHGGGFRAGHGEVSGEAIARHGVVVVSFNYRLGPLGFFAHAKSETPVANLAVLDMAAALGWVRDNIAAFGGDPDQVTIFGVSAGAMAVEMLMVAPQARGLFHGAIAQSGYATWPLPRTPNVSGTIPRGIDLGPAADAQAITKSVLDAGGGMDTADLTLAQLRELSAEALVNAYEGFQLPIVDGVTLLEEPGLMFLSGQQAPVPFLTGGNSHEGTVMPGSGVDSAE